MLLTAKVCHCHKGCTGYYLSLLHIRFCFFSALKSLQVVFLYPKITRSISLGCFTALLIFFKFIMPSISMNLFSKTSISPRALILGGSQSKTCKSKWHYRLKLCVYTKPYYSLSCRPSSRLPRRSNQFIRLRGGMKDSKILIPSFARANHCCFYFLCQIHNVTRLKSIHMIQSHKPMRHCNPFDAVSPLLFRPYLYYDPVLSTFTGI